MGFWEYAGRLWCWNELDPEAESDSDVDAPSGDWMKHQQMRLAKKGWATGSIH